MSVLDSPECSDEWSDLTLLLHLDALYENSLAIEECNSHGTAIVRALVDKDSMVQIASSLL